jgi:amino acid transporter
MAAWMYWTSNLPYFPAVLYFAASNLLFMRESAHGHLGASPAFFMLFALAMLALATVMNLVGLDVGKWLHNAGALAMWGPVAIAVIMGIAAWRSYGSATQFTWATMTPRLGMHQIITWSVLTFAFGGSETASFMGGEIRNPRRNLPLGLLIAGITVASSYIIGTISLLLALPHERINGLEGLMQAISLTGHRLGWTAVIPLAAFLIALSNVGAAGAFLAATSRLPFVAGIDKFLPASFGRLHPRWKTPRAAILTNAGLGAVFIVLGQAGTSVKGAYDVLVSMGVITYFIPYLYVFAAMIRLQREPAGPEVIRVPGGTPMARLVASVGFTVTLMVIAVSLLPPPDEPNPLLAVLKILGLSGALVALGAAVYLAGRKHAAGTS